MVFSLFSSGKDRNLNILELLCATCCRWFHESCIGFQMGKLIPFATNYIFFCKNCSHTGLESFKKLQACKSVFISSSNWLWFNPSQFLKRKFHKCIHFFFSFENIWANAIHIHVYISKANSFLHSKIEYILKRVLI